MIIVAALVGVTSVHGQPMSREPTAAEVATLLRTRGHAGAAQAVLTQAYSVQPQQKMDEIADTLVVIAATFPGDDFRGAHTRGAALITLLLAGQGSSGIVGINRAVPYAGAVDRLIRIAETAQDVGISGQALDALTKLPDKSRLLPFLRQIATSQNAAAWVAVGILIRETGPEGQTIARELCRGGLVKERNAWEDLDRLAAVYGLRSPRLSCAR
jgi:hypothetical protein